MAYREAPVFEVQEVLRLWLGGETLRGIERLSRVDARPCGATWRAPLRRA